MKDAKDLKYGDRVKVGFAIMSVVRVEGRHVLVQERGRYPRRVPLASVAKVEA